jgi:formylglycine-generating enzyme required for sulfatase activity
VYVPKVPIVLVSALVLLSPSACSELPERVNDGYGEFLLVPAGSFLMGDHFEEGNSDEIPVHEVYVDAFYVGRHKVTNQAFRRFMGDGGYQDEALWTAGGFGEHGTAPDHWFEEARWGGGLPGNEDYPVVGVSWFEASAYCSWLSAKTGAVYRLPTEAEWEKAARGRLQTRFPWGNEISSVHASYDSGEPRDLLRLTPVGFFNGQDRNGLPTRDNSSPYGAFDMAGNTSEWCLDWYGRDYYSASPGENPTGPESGTSRVLRGGGYVDSGYYQRSAGRHKMGAHFKSYKASFRCIREPEGAQVQAPVVPGPATEAPPTPPAEPSPMEPHSPNTSSPTPQPPRQTQPPPLPSGAALNEGFGDYLPVPAGEFLMGDNYAEGDPDEIPVHAVTLDAFYIGRDKVTNGEYARFLEAGGYGDQRFWVAGGFGEYGEAPRYWDTGRYRSSSTGEDRDFPVVGVSWYEASAYCSWVAHETGSDYRLPTEAEWEKAARGTDQRRFPWGQEIDGSFANYEFSGGPFEPGISPVGFYDGSIRHGFQTSVNLSPAGVREMTGNVWEWCSDWYGGDYYLHSPSATPPGPEQGSSKVLRAGGWVDSHYYHRAANRNSSFPENRNPIQGFRCARSF